MDFTNSCTLRYIRESLLKTGSSVKKLDGKSIDRVA